MAHLAWERQKNFYAAFFACENFRNISINPLMMRRDAEEEDINMMIGAVK